MKKKKEQERAKGRRVLLRGMAGSIWRRGWRWGMCACRKGRGDAGEGESRVTLC